MSGLIFLTMIGGKLFKPTKENGFTLFEIVGLVAIMALVFAFGAPKYISCINDTHNANIDIMVSNIKIWSSEQAIYNLRNEGRMRYPLPKSVKIKEVMRNGKIGNWDDSQEEQWIYIAGGGIYFEGDGIYLDVIPIYIK